MSNNNHIVNEIAAQFFGEALTQTDGLTEIAVNRPNQMYLKVKGKWIKKDTLISYDDCKSFASALADFCSDSVSETKPILSATLPTGERVQVVLPPATEQDTISITIRKPSDIFISHEMFVEQGFYSKLDTQAGNIISPATKKLTDLYNSGDIETFIPECLKQGKTIAFCGGTGSGKTTFGNSLLEYIPHHLRVISIEDTPEVKLRFHDNHVRLFYPSEGGKNSIITPAMLLRACYRMNPDRILMTEVRGAEAWDFLKGNSSGHAGGITTLHEDTPMYAVSGMIERCQQNSECHNLPYNVLLRKVLNNIDVILSIKYLDEFDKRYATGIYFKDIHKEQYFNELRD
ncbi:TPA: P-type DNA transfer ATPase VirB11 [Klebsiella pneumoniae]|uniref:P-type DNA transfer ATPase VirB11 n=1 Tax=Morganella morganii TaxID=582 RepID=UPI001A180052|nr:P-type DNA transfer ATPase VirB11 [Morganella morganii]HDQ2581595.1 P-type DNA transfer ATPase VirB11 [Morganella morganii]